MLFPAFTFGLYRSVLAECRKRVTFLTRGTSWNECIDDEWIETAKVSGLLVLHGPSPLLGGSPHFHAFLLPMLVRDALIGGRMASLAAESLFSEFLSMEWTLDGRSGAGPGCATCGRRSALLVATPRPAIDGAQVEAWRC